MMRGVSAAKEDVHNAIKNIDKGIYPQAFCKIIPDILGNDPEYCNIMHADGAGTKSSLAYMYQRMEGYCSGCHCHEYRRFIVCRCSRQHTRFKYYWKEQNACSWRGYISYYQWNRRITC